MIGITGRLTSETITEVVLVNPVQITKSDELWRPLDQISAVRASTAGRLEPSDVFPQSTWVRWTRQEYDDASRLEFSRVYHTIPASGFGTEGANYDETQYGYDAMGRQNRLRSPGGTITRTVYDVLGRTTETWVGTNDEGATDDDPGGGSGNTDNNMVVVTTNEYDFGLDGGDSNLTLVTQHVDASTARETQYGYDWRDRQIVIDGEEDFYQTTEYDNLDRPVRVDRYDTDDEGNLIARNETFYDNRSRVYRTRRYAVSGGNPGHHLEDNYWFDQAENEIKRVPAGSEAFTKTEYDGLRRVTATYVGFDNPVSSSSSWSSSSSNSNCSSSSSEEPYSSSSSEEPPSSSSSSSEEPGSSSEEPFDSSSSEELVSSSSSTSSSSEEFARLTAASFAASDVTADDKIFEQTYVSYDDASNVLATAFYQRTPQSVGNGPLQPPYASEPRARVSYQSQWYDGVGRQIAAANYGTNDNAAFTRPATVPARSDDVLVTTTGYDAAGHAFQSIDPAAKETRREFDAADRVTKTIDNDTGGCPCADKDITVATTYTPDGQTATLTAVNPTTGDQVTTYEYGTTLADSDVARSDLLRAVRYPDSEDEDDRVTYAYNRQGQQTEFTDQNATVHNYDYDGLGRRTADRVTLAGGSAIDDAVLRIETTYEVRGMVEKITSYDAASGGSVVNEVLRTYNDFGQLAIEYQAHGGAVNTSTTPKVEYGYASGSGNTVRPESLTYPDGRVLVYNYSPPMSSEESNDDDGRLSRVASLENDVGDGYVAYKYLGVSAITQTDSEWEAALSWYPGLDRFGRSADCRWQQGGWDVERIRYGYDRASNRTWRENMIAPASGNDELYTYDGAQRLVDMSRGNLATDKRSIEDLGFAQHWDLDATGNWSQLIQTDPNDPAQNLNQIRASNPVNEITVIARTYGAEWVTPAYDRAGNMTLLPRPKQPTDGYAAIYDAWNRLVLLEAVESSSTSASSSSAPTSQAYAYDGLTRRITVDDGNVVRHSYFSARWQVLEERLDASADPERQFVWGLRYIDDLVLRDRATSSSSSGTLDERLYALQDANWNVTAVADPFAGIKERYRYDAYGQVTVLDANFEPKTPNESDYDWETLYCGYRYDPATGVCNVRYRLLNSLVAWLTRDPLHIGPNLYLYDLCNPLTTTDPYGLVCSCPGGRWTYTGYSLSGSLLLGRSVIRAVAKCDKAEVRANRQYSCEKIGECFSKRIYCYCEAILKITTWSLGLQLGGAGIGVRGWFSAATDNDIASEGWGLSFSFTLGAFGGEAGRDTSDGGYNAVGVSPGVQFEPISVGKSWVEVSGSGLQCKREALTIGDAFTVKNFGPCTSKDYRINPPRIETNPFLAD